MKIALLGYGKMGRLVEQLAKDQGHQIVATCSRQLGKVADQLERLQQADVCIDFSHAECVLEHIQLCGEQKKNLVIGTTGWEKEQDLAQSLVEKYQIGCVYAPNFAVGVHLFMKLLAYAARLLDPFSDYDVGAWESHHNQKKDHPSGTAKALTNLLLQNMNRLESLQFTSFRCGFDPGTHSICFDSPYDKITLTHESRSRTSFAQGAIKAAEWIRGKNGFYTLEEMLTWN